MNFNKCYLALLLTVLSCLSYNVSAIEVYRANFESKGINYPIDIALYNNDVPVTVSNFHAYLDGGFFNNLLINRSVPGFILQAGAFTFDNTLNDGSFSYSGNGQFNGGLQPVISQGSVNNEFMHSNLRGTIAMAKISGAPDSATSEWFINLTDNAFLDDENGGYTVFGKILGGMSDIDLISNTPVKNLSIDFINDVFFNTSNFTDTPLYNYTNTSVPGDITKNDLLIINNFTPLFQLTNVVQFSGVTDQTEKTIIIKNNNNTPISLATIDTTSVLPPFSITQNLCNALILNKGQQCIIKAKFTTPINTAGYFSNEFNINIEPYGYVIPVTLKIPTPKISAAPIQLDYGFVPIYTPETLVPEFSVINIKNTGDKDLNITSVIFETNTPDEFKFFDNCTTSNNEYAPGKVRAQSSCFLVMHFKPTNLDVKYASITVISNDPLNNRIQIPVTYGATTDSDGISSDIESAAPNAGDGNNDDAPDRYQNNVVSFSYENSPYITLITDKTARFTNTSSSNPNNISTLPTGAIFGYGIFNFELKGVAVGGLAEIGLILKSGETPSNFYIYGPNSNNQNDHWYKLAKDSTPGMETIGNASIQSPSNNSINRNLTMLRIVDGGFGDADMIANGTIMFIGGPVISDNYNAIETNTGAALWGSILIIIVSSTSRRKVHKH